MAEAEQTSSTRLRPAQVFGTTLAAVSGAFFASKLGVYGTIVGVGVISLMSTVGGELYLRSLDRTKAAAKTATDAARARMAFPVATLPAAGPDAGADPAATEQLVRVADTHDLAAATTEEIASSADIHESPIPNVEALDVADAGRGLRWPLIATGTVAAFVLAMLVITGIEALTGSSLSGSKGSTVAQVIGDRSGPSSSDDQPGDESDDQPDGPVPAPTSTPSPDDETGGESGPRTEPPAEPTEPPVDETELPEETEPPEEIEPPGETEPPEETQPPDETEPPE